MSEDEQPDPRPLSLVNFSDKGLPEEYQGQYQQGHSLRSHKQDLHLDGRKETQELAFKTPYGPKRDRKKT